MSRSLSYKAQLKDPKDISFVSFFGAQNYLLSFEGVRIPTKALQLGHHFEGGINFGETLAKGIVADAQASIRDKKLTLDRHPLHATVSGALAQLGYEYQAKAIPWKPVEGLDVNFFKKGKEKIPIRRGGDRIAY